MEFFGVHDLSIDRRSLGKQNERACGFGQLVVNVLCEYKTHYIKEVKK
jgi:hypothetical protein